MNTPLAPWALPESDTPATAGARPSPAAPSTVKSPSSVIACVPRPSAALLFAASRIIPPFSASAAAPTEIPFASASAATTV